MRTNQPDVLTKKKTIDSLANHVYSHVMPSHSALEYDPCYSFTDSYSIADTFISLKRGRNQYDRVVALSIKQFESKNYLCIPINSFSSWLNFLCKSKQIYLVNLFSNRKVPVAHTLVPAQKSAFGMSHGCHEYVVIPKQNMKVIPCDSETLKYTDDSMRLNISEGKASDIELLSIMIDQINELTITNSRKNFMLKEISRYKKSSQ